MEKTAAYYRQFLAGKPIAASNDLLSEPRDLKQVVGKLDPSELGLFKAEKDKLLHGILRQFISSAVNYTRCGRSTLSTTCRRGWWALCSASRQWRHYSIMGEVHDSTIVRHCAVSSRAGSSRVWGCDNGRGFVYVR